jgi:ABC-type multidrug transport system fused ATPase/permease subunit
MKDIRSIHREAMALAKEANEALLNGSPNRFIDLSRQAFHLERDAANRLYDEFDSEPTRSVLYRSAATLAYNIGEFREAKELIHLALSGKPHAEIFEELEALLQKVDTALVKEIDVYELSDKAYPNVRTLSKVICIVNYYKEEVRGITKHIQSHYFNFFAGVTALVIAVLTFRSVLIGIFKIDTTIGFAFIFILVIFSINLSGNLKKIRSEQKAQRGMKNTIYEYFHGRHHNSPIIKDNINIKYSIVKSKKSALNE